MTERPAYKPKSCEECPLLVLGKGFVVGVGDPRAAKIMITLEGPALEETNFSVWPPPGPKKRYVLGDIREAQAEMRRRRERYPEIEPRLLSRGVPVVGRTGIVLNRLLEDAGIQREDVFLDNAMRCTGVKNKQGGNWPTGNAKHIAISHCRTYDRLDEFRPTVAVFSIHPSAVLREQTPYLLIVEDLRKVKEFADAGERVLLLMGGNAVDTYFGFFKNVTKSRGHYEFVGAEWLTKRTEYLRVKAEKARRAGMPREKKKSKSQIARETLGMTIVNNLMGMGFFSFQDSGENSGYAEALGIVVAALTPPPRPKKSTPVAPATSPEPPNVA